MQAPPGGSCATRAVRLSWRLRREFAIEAGDAFVVTAGCDKSFATCGAKFGNRDSFRGFPHMPGTDAVLAGPASDRSNDGGRRG